VCICLAIQCETTAGMNELTRVAVVNERRQCVYHSLVKPRNEITNYLTQYVTFLSASALAWWQHTCGHPASNVCTGQMHSAQCAVGQAASIRAGFSWWEAWGAA